MEKLDNKCVSFTLLNRYPNTPPKILYGFLKDGYIHTEIRHLASKDYNIEPYKKWHWVDCASRDKYTDWKEISVDDIPSYAHPVNGLICAQQFIDAEPIVDMVSNQIIATIKLFNCCGLKLVTQCENVRTTDIIQYVRMLTNGAFILFKTTLQLNYNLIRITSDGFNLYEIPYNP